MKKLLIIFILISQMYSVSFALSLFSDKEEKNNLIGNAGISFLIPVDENLTGSNKFLSTLLLTSFFVGVGYHLNIIENIFSPGIYGDIHLNIFPALYLLLISSSANEIKDIENYEKINGSNPFLVFQTGIRIYNYFRVDLFDVQPFIGLNLLTGSVYAMTLKTFGISVTYKNFGLEYSYQQPLTNHISNIKGSIHRIVFVSHIR